MARLFSGASARTGSFAVTFGIFAAFAACNQLLGNDTATRQPADASDPQGSSSSGSGGLAEAGPADDAAVRPDAGSTCPCGQTGATCNACPLEPLADFSAAGNFAGIPLEIAATDAYLFVRTDDNGRIVRYRLPNTENAGLWDRQTIVKPGLQRIAAGLPVLVSTLFAIFVESANGAPILRRVDSSLGPTDEFNVYLASPDTSAAPDGVLGLELGTGNVHYISQLNDERLVDKIVASKLTFYTANERFGFVGQVQEGITTVHRVRAPLAPAPNDGAETFQLEGPVEVATANDETLFFACADGHAVCQVSATSDGTSVASQVLSLDSPAQTLVADGPLLLASTSLGQSYAFDAPTATTLLELPSQRLVSTTRNTSTLFALVGTTLYQARRSPLVPPP